MIRLQNSPLNIFYAASRSEQFQQSSIKHEHLTKTSIC